MDVNKSIWKILDTIFPPHCSGCEKWGVRLCGDCFQSIRIIYDPICDCCGEPMVGSAGSICARCKSTNLSFDHIRSWAVFDGVVKRSIHKLKYQKDIGLGMILSLPMTTMLKDLDWQVDLIIPVPLDKERLKSRGYNQASLLAKPIADDIGVQFDGKNLTKIKKTRPQVGLSIDERTKNVSNAFRFNNRIVSRKNILLIDDVITTGSTINSCAAALKESGARMVYGISLARSLRL